MARIETLDELRTLYGVPKNVSVEKELDALDIHMRRIIQLSPFCLLGSHDGKGNADVTPRGDKPGFVKILNDTTLLMPDRSGNNRLDTLQNILACSEVGMWFLVPGINDTLRVNGHAEIRDDSDLREMCGVDGTLPKTVIQVQIQSAYIHCPKAFMRSRLWDTSTHINRDALPSMSAMLKDQLAAGTEIESDEAREQRYNRSLW